MAAASDPFAPFDCGKAKVTTSRRRCMIEEEEVIRVCNLPHEPRGKLYGQDYVLTYKLPDVSGMIQIVADGNGANGEVVSLFCAETLLYCLEVCAPLLLHYCLDDDMSSIEKTMKECFLLVDERLCTTPGPDAYACNSGSTCTALLILVHETRRFVLTSYIGDSPALIVCSDGESKLLTEYEHNPENVQEFRRHVLRMQNAGLEPEPYTLHRVNYQGHPQVEYPAPGHFQPIPLYVQEQVQDGIQYVINLEGIRALQAKGMPVGGCQSLRRYVERDPDTGSMVAIPGHEHENMASTVNGITQLTRCFGNLIQKPQVDAEPTVILHEVKPECAYTVSVMSDGVGDLWFLNADDPDIPSWVTPESILPVAILEALRSGVRLEEFGKYVMTSSFEHARNQEFNPSFQVVLGADGEESPKWDDCSVVGVFLPPL